MKTSNSGFYAVKKFLQKTNESDLQGRNFYKTSHGGREAIFHAKPHQKYLKRKIFFSFVEAIAFIYKLKVS